MKQKSNIVNYYRLSLAQGECYRSFLTEDYRLDGKGGGYFTYLAKVFDTTEYDSTYHRLLLKGSFCKCKFEILVAATNKDISRQMHMEDITPQEQQEILKELPHIRRVNTEDILLHDIKGRYLWIYISVTASDLNAWFEIDGFSMEFPRSSFVEYLPEIYQEAKDNFFARYMAGLQSLYVDLESEVDSIPMQLDYETTREENLPMFAEWLGLNAQGIHFTPKQIKYLIRYLQQIQSGKGTKAVMEQMLYLLTGKKVRVVEYFKWHDWMKNSSRQADNYKRLFGRDETVFTIIVDYSDAGEQLPASHEKLLKLIEQYMPLGMRCNLVFLRESSNMDTHCYMDINGHLSTPTTADTRGFILGSNHVLG